MDHPDMPAGMRLPKRKKISKKPEKSTTSQTPSSTAPTKSSSEYGVSEPRERQRSYPTIPQSSTLKPVPPVPFPIHGDNVRHSFETGELPSRRSESGDSGRKLSFLSRMKKPDKQSKTVRSTPNVLTQRIIASEHPDLGATRAVDSREPIFALTSSSNNSNQAIATMRPDSMTSIEAPTVRPLPTPTWMLRGNRRAEEHLRYTDARQQGFPASPPPNAHLVQLRPIQLEDEQAGRLAMGPTTVPSSGPIWSGPQPPLPPLPPLPSSAHDPHWQQQNKTLFATATSGLAPNQAQPDPERSIYPHSLEHHGLPASLVPGSGASASSYRHHSASSGSVYSVVADPEERYTTAPPEIPAKAEQRLVTLPRSAPDLLTARQVRSTSVPHGHLLTKLATNSSHSSHGSRTSPNDSLSLYEQPSPPAPQRQSSQPSTPLDYRQQRPVSPIADIQQPHTSHMQAFYTPTDESRAETLLTATGRPTHQISHASLATSEDRVSFSIADSTDGIPFIPSRSVSPMPNLQQDMTSLSIDTGAPRMSPNFASNYRQSAVSALSNYEIDRFNHDVSPIDEGDVSPLDQDELPDYATSQEEMARIRQIENERRARELQALWLASNAGRT
ncbi:hypothetical protein K461DRAFT_267076 [Myriangium duriaei CBS 260.36]|uniref:Uncharacterized protein n=1 Tax=Myriangium duriaei CBS 260.36 TaxID=1168546 RepID=A0A9P4J3R7_9PEZI|nr:hypothetical protein K461DRAFT_267076 [Myriangium duriaei CBS 260.36]